MDWASIIGGLFGPLLAKCFSKFSSEDPQSYLRASYNSATGRMDPSVVRDSMGQMRKAVRKAKRQEDKKDRKNFPRYNEQEIYDMTEKQLIEAMTAPREKIQAVFATALSMTDDDE